MLEKKPEGQPPSLAKKIAIWCIGAVMVAVAVMLVSLVVGVLWHFVVLVWSW